ncbi:MAG TPA: hypothetical protein VEZ48_00365 [Sphingomonadaceae bacterium]|nr:hypothetical protein [Sphingomonadaceae bacterium]
MFAYILIVGSVLTVVVPRDIVADAPRLHAATGGLVADAAPTLAYDMDALAAYELGARPPTPARLSYAGYDTPGFDWPELKVAHATAAEIIRDSGDEQTTPNQRR